MPTRPDLTDDAMHLQPGDDDDILLGRVHFATPPQIGGSPAAQVSANLAYARRVCRLISLRSLPCFARRRLSIL